MAIIDTRIKLEECGECKRREFNPAIKKALKIILCSVDALN